MNCPVCNLRIPDELVKTRPCEKCGCMDLMTDYDRKRYRALKELESEMMLMVDKVKKEK